MDPNNYAIARQVLQHKHAITTWDQAHARHSALNNQRPYTCIWHTYCKRQAAAQAAEMYTDTPDTPPPHPLTRVRYNCARHGRYRQAARAAAAEAQTLHSARDDTGKCRHSKTIAPPSTGRHVLNNPSQDTAVQMQAPLLPSLTNTMLDWMTTMADVSTA